VLVSDVETGVRELLAAALGRDPAEIAALPADTPLFNGPLGVGSLTGVRLLAGVKDRFGVDVVAEDLTLESLESIATLTRYVAARR
jgi:acyl carrier protein